MKRQLLILFALAAVLISSPMNAADAAHGHRGGFRLRSGHGHGHGFGNGLGFGAGGYGDIYGYAELYRELLDNIPYFALHPPVYYSEHVPRTYGYSPFAYPGSVMTPEIAAPPQPLDIINPHVPSNGQKTEQKPADRAAAIQQQPEPLVILNPFVAPNRAVAQASER
jgi:hypothetical protein